MGVHPGLEINFLTHSQNFASASKMYSLKSKMESLLAKIEIKTWPEHTDDIWVPYTMTALITTAYFAIHRGSVDGCWILLPLFFFDFLDEIEDYRFINTGKLLRTKK